MKKLTTLMAAMLLTCSAQAQQVTLENARTEAASFFQSHGMSISGGVKLSARVARRAQGTTTGSSTDAAYYIFNGANNKGFVVISGDDRTEPVLGYSTTDTYDAASIPPNMKAFLDGYAAQIAQMDASSAAAIRRVKKHAKIAPLIQTKWNQISPYNDLCPNDDDTRSYTGCEATSVAQIMAYHQWPKANTTAIPAYTTETKKINVPALPPVKFNWDAMPESGDKDQAVATLMRYVGQGEQMDYTSQGSNSNDGPAIYALKTYFGYDQNIKYYNRPSYTISEWDSIIYASLTEKNPVLYGYPVNPQKTVNIVEFYYPEEIVMFERDFIEAQRAAYMETAIEDDEIAERMDAGRLALHKRNTSETGPYQSPLEDGMQHFHEWYNRIMNH